MYSIVHSHGQDHPGCRLQCGDLLKLGRIKFFVRELCLNGQKQKSDSNVLFMRSGLNSIVAPFSQQLPQSE